jgi:hypothetical protein
LGAAESVRRARPVHDESKRGREPSAKPKPLYSYSEQQRSEEPRAVAGDSSLEILTGAQVSPDERLVLLDPPADRRPSSQRIERLTRVLRMSQRLSSTLDPDALLDTILDDAIELARAQRALLILDDTGGELRMARGRSAGGESIPNDLTKVSLTLARRCIEQNRVQVYDNLGSLPEMREVQSIRLNDLYSAI